MLITYEGRWGVIGIISIGALLHFMGFQKAWWLILPLAVLWALFCRNPFRTLQPEPGVWVAPADGKVVEVTPLADGRTHIGIFMNLWNVHVNRFPYSGKILSVTHQKGRFLPAFRPNATVVNEQICTEVQSGPFQYRIVQIAGVLARRIRFWKYPGADVKTGEPFGMILLGSRVDVYLPPGVKPLVQLGTRTRAGITILARSSHA